MGLIMRAIILMELKKALALLNGVMGQHSVGSVAIMSLMVL